MEVDDYTSKILWKINNGIKIFGGFEKNRIIIKYSHSSLEIQLV